jgi:hypothetical protein
MIRQTGGALLFLLLSTTQAASVRQASVCMIHFSFDRRRRLPRRLVRAVTAYTMTA